mmetsp:Transcript_87848/g.169098  ORF Transcript_87848/g.169098 Transcript_87848/m.169098 type:complete len:83 (-) Transcript_87848:494-742(-)
MAAAAESNNALLYGYRKDLAVDYYVQTLGCREEDWRNLLGVRVGTAFPRKTGPGEVPRADVNDWPEGGHECCFYGSRGKHGS